MDKRTKQISLLIPFISLTAPCNAAPHPGVFKDPLSIFKHLVDSPAPTRNWKDPALGLFRDNPPGDAESIKRLVAYWTSTKATHGIPSEKAPLPSSIAKGRLIEAARLNPRILPSLLTFLGEEGESYNQVAEILETGEKTKTLSAEQIKEVQDWLMVRGPYFRDQLEQRAKAVRFDEGFLDGKDELAALARLDWAKAEPLLLSLEGQKDARIRALSLVYQYRHFRGNAPIDEAEARERLKGIATDPIAPGTARDLSFEALMETEWPGREEWFLSQFSDGTLLRLTDGSMAFLPLAYPVQKSPEHWIPLVARFIGGKDHTAHNNAASVLAKFNLSETREDALRPLIPWLSDPNWAGPQDWSPSDRLRLIQSMDRVNLPNCVPGLIWVLQHSREPFEIEGAAEGIAHHRDIRGVVAMKSALTRLLKKVSPAQHATILSAIVQCGGYTDSALVRMVESYATWKAQQKDSHEQRAPSGLDAGRLLLWKKENRDRLAPILIARITSLAESSPKSAAAIWDLIHDWDQPSVDQERVARLKSGHLDLGSLQALMADRKRIRTSSTEALVEISQRGGWRLGLVAALGEDHEQQHQLLVGEDRKAKFALLASARAGLVPLLVSDVVNLARSADPNLSKASARYLEALDTEEARLAFWALHPKEIRIIGMPAGTAIFNPSIRSWEETLRKEMIQNPDVIEIVGMHESSNWGDGPKLILRRTKIGATIAKTGGPESGANAIPKALTLRTAVVDDFLKFIREQKIDDLPPLYQGVIDGPEWVYLHLTRDGGKRIYMNDPTDYDGAGSIYPLLVTRVLELLETAELDSRNATK